MATAFLLGSTGMVGSHILQLLRSSPSVSKVDIVARRNPPSTEEPDNKLTTFVDTDLSKWAGYLRSLQPAPQIYFCAFATTKANAGSFENQKKLEQDFNIEMAKEAKEAGTKVFVLISASGASSASRFPYIKMKGEIEEQVKELEFDHTIIVRPGLISGKRHESRPAEALIRKIADIAGAIHGSLKNSWAQDADVIAKAAVSAGLKVLNGESPQKVWILGQSDIVKFGLTEWKE